jgi:tRNA modification GTPase
MKMNLDDTIVAWASATGPGARAVIRLSGPQAIEFATQIFQVPEGADLSLRRWHRGEIQLRPIDRRLPARLLVWPPPRTYTGQAMSELHFISSPPLVELVLTDLMKIGARAARPGEFTLRAFLNGRRDLSRAEAVQAVVSAGNRDELRAALAHLAGGVSKPLQQLRDDLLNLLADVEAGLDFVEEDIGFVSQREILLRLTHAMAHLTTLKRQVQKRSIAERPFRVVLTGLPNAGKSSLFNALTGSIDALVSPDPGTTRDYLTRCLTIGQTVIELMDTAGWQTPGSAIEEQAQRLGAEVAQYADLVLVCIESGRLPNDDEQERLRQTEPPVLGVATKCDLADPASGLLPTSARSGEGLETLRQRILNVAQNRPTSSWVPTVTRCLHHLDAALEALRRAHAASLQDDPPEILALELHHALDEIGATVGEVYTEDLLDRIFARFCIGK